MTGVTFTAGSGLNDSIYGKSEDAIKMIIEKKAEAMEQQSLLPSMFAMGTSDHFSEKITGLTAMTGFLPKGENALNPIDEMQEGYAKTIEHEEWGDEFSISRKIMDDSIVSEIKNRPAAFTAGYYRSRERFGAGLFEAALDATTFTFPGSAYSFSTLGADGKRLFAEDHPSKVSGADQINSYTNAFSVDALGLVESAMQGYKGDNGEILALAPDTIIIPNHHSLKRDVFAAIGADKDPETANNATNYQFGRWNVIINPYLNEFDSSTKFWILCDSKYNQMNMCAAWFDRVSLEVDNYIDKKTGASVWTGYGRWGAGFSDWRAFAVGGNSTSSTTLA